MHAATARENFLLLQHKKSAVVQNRRALCSQPHKEDSQGCFFQKYNERATFILTREEDYRQEDGGNPSCFPCHPPRLTHWFFPASFPVLLAQPSGWLFLETYHHLLQGYDVPTFRMCQKQNHPQEKKGTNSSVCTSVTAL